MVARLSEENIAIYRKAMESQGVLFDSNPALVVIPSGQQIEVPLSQERIDAYKCHLIKMIDSAFQGANSEDDKNRDAHNKLNQTESKFEQHPEVRNVSDLLCSMCKGGCCSVGQNHGFISGYTMRCYVEAHPKLTQQEVLNNYLSVLKPRSVSNSCINQTAAGCLLPREMRAHICNGFYCTQLLEYQSNACAQVKAGKPPSALAVQRANVLTTTYDANTANPVVSVAVVEKNNIRYIDEPT